MLDLLLDDFKKLVDARFFNVVPNLITNGGLELLQIVHRQFLRVKSIRDLLSVETGAFREEHVRTERGQPSVTLRLCGRTTTGNNEFTRHLAPEVCKLSLEVNCATIDRLAQSHTRDEVCLRVVRVHNDFHQTVGAGDHRRELCLVLEHRTIRHTVVRDFCPSKFLRFLFGQRVHHVGELADNLQTITPFFDIFKGVILETNEVISVVRVFRFKFHIVASLISSSVLTTWCLLSMRLSHWILRLNHKLRFEIRRSLS